MQRWLDVLTSSCPYLLLGLLVRPQPSGTSLAAASNTRKDGNTSSSPTDKNGATSSVPSNKGKNDGAPFATPNLGKNGGTSSVTAPSYNGKSFDASGKLIRDESNLTRGMLAVLVSNLGR
jgi:hypothetical protein